MTPHPPAVSHTQRNPNSNSENFAVLQIAKAQPTRHTIGDLSTQTSFKKWWHKPLILELGKQRQEDL